MSAASIQGTVRDGTGAFIPGAEVLLRNIETGIELRNSSKAAGEYVFVNIAPGSYTLRVAKEGFQSAQRPEFELSVSQGDGDGIRTSHRKLDGGTWDRS